MTNTDTKFQELLAPIVPHSPTGRNVRYEEVYDIIRTLRTYAEYDLEHAHHVEWKKIAIKAEETLKQDSKDLQIAAWLAEASCHLEELPGLESGLAIIQALCEEYWGALYPMDEEDPEVTLVPFYWLNDKLPDAILHVAITQPEFSDVKTYHLYDLIDARETELSLQKAGDKREAILKEAEQKGRPLFKDIFKSALNTKLSFFTRLGRQVESCVNVVTKLEEFLATNAHTNSPPTLTHIRNKLEDIKLFAEKALEDLTSQEDDYEPEDAVDEEVEIEEVDPLKNYTTQELLDECITRLETHDSDSLIALMLKRAQHWAQLPPGTLMKYFVENNIHLSELYRIFKD